MSQKEKLIARLKSIPADFTYSEAKALCSFLGYAEHNKGKTSGSRVLLFRKSDNSKILLHKPHPGDIMKKYAVRDLLAYLRENGDIK